MLEVGCHHSVTCQGVSRRSFVQVGTLGALGLTLPDLLMQRAAHGSDGRARSVILLWLWGGPSQLDTFDPKPDAPLEIRGPFRPISTKVPGIHICELFPQLAALADHYAIVRSMSHDQSDHNVGGTVALTGVPAGGRIGGGVAVPGTRKPTLGSLIARLKGIQPGRWPPFLTIGAPCLVSHTALSGQDAAGLGAAYEPFRVECSPEHAVQMPPSFRLPPGVDTKRLADRRSKLSLLEETQLSRLQAVEMKKHREYYRQAFALLTSTPARKAFDIEEEPERLRDRYGRTRFGQSCLLARRLVEAGVPFIQVNWSTHAEDEQTSAGDGGWDGHWRMFELMQERFAWILDIALSALLIDLKRRGLLDTTLIVVMGEFGRTPKINGCGGRDHWPNVYSALVAGGGVPGGRVVGQSDAQAAEPSDRPVHPTNLHATVLRAMGLDPVPLTQLGVGVDARPVEELSW